MAFNFFRPVSVLAIAASLGACATGPAPANIAGASWLPGQNLTSGSGHPEGDSVIASPVATGAPTCDWRAPRELDNLRRARPEEFLDRTSPLSPGDRLTLRLLGDEDVLGGTGDDVLTGDAGDNRLSGGDGDDRLSDGAGCDALAGGAGDDLVIAAADGCDDHYDGGDGEDLLDYSATTQGIDADLAAGTVTGAEVGTDVITHFEALTGGAGDDRFTFGAGDAQVTGGGGDDLYVFDPAEESAPSASSVYEITDYNVGDCIRIDRFNLFEQPADPAAPSDAAYFVTAAQGMSLLMQAGADPLAGIARTTIEYLSGESITLLTVYVDGTHVFYVSELA